MIERANSQSLFLPYSTSNFFGALSNATRNVLDILQTHGLTVTPVKADQVATEEIKEFDNSDKNLLKDEVTAEVEVEEIGTCPLCGQVMLIKVLPQHASDCQDPEVG